MTRAIRLFVLIEGGNNRVDGEKIGDFHRYAFFD